jgi:uncharacterized protein YjiS (DUF1127 family)
MHGSQTSYAILCDAKYFKPYYTFFQQSEAAGPHILIVPRCITTRTRAMFDNVVKNYRQWRNYRTTVSELSRLSTRDLNDLGIGRGEIEFVARRAASK